MYRYKNAHEEAVAGVIDGARRALPRVEYAFAAGRASKLNSVAAERVEIYRAPVAAEEERPRHTGCAGKG